MLMRGIVFILTFIFPITLINGQTITRDSLLSQLKNLKTAVLQEHKESVAGFFSFPITDRDFKIKVELDGKPNINSPFDKDAFIKYYHRSISSNLHDVLKYLDLNKLKTQNELTRKIIPKDKKDECYYTYEIVIKNNEIIISSFTNTRTDIKLSDDDMCPEYMERWTFNMVKGKLKFKKIDIAG